LHEFLQLLLMKHYDPTFHDSAVDLFSELEGLEGPRDHGACVILSLGANQPILSNHVGYGDSYDSPLRKAV
jgi:hypothetical protein